MKKNLNIWENTGKNFEIKMEGSLSQMTMLRALSTTDHHHRHQFFKWEEFSF